MLQNIDVNKMHKIMDENQEVKNMISQLLENHRSIISLLSHEIRNPLTLISSTLQVIELKHPEVCNYPEWSPLIDDVNFLRLLLEDFSLLNNSQTLHDSVFSLEKFFKNIAVSFAISLEHKQNPIEFCSQIPPNLGNFSGDRLKLEQVLLNLLRNAKEACKTNGRISFSVFRRTTALIIQITDNGCGIPQEHLKTIFDPFVTYKSNGTGLGLTISKQIIEAHNGTITVQSAPGSGSIFSIHLPL